MRNRNDVDKLKNSQSLFRYAVLLFWADLFFLALTFLTPWWFKIGFLGSEVVESYGMVLLLSIILFITLSMYENIYRIDRLQKQLESMKDAIKVALMLFGALLVIAFSLKITSDFSRVWAGTWIVLFFIYLLASRMLVTFLIERDVKLGKISRKTIIIGAGTAVQDIYNDLSLSSRQGIHVLAVFDDNPDVATIEYKRISVIGKIDQLSEFLQDWTIDQAIIVLPWQDEDKIESIKKILSNWAVDVYLAPENLTYSKSTRPITKLGNSHYFTLQSKPITGWSSFMKRAEDITVAILGLLVLWPVFLITAIAIKLESKGPIFFKQERYGFNHELIKVFKFRSMYTDMTDKKAAQQTTANDPRVTRVGWFIRKASIDELPQIFNVLIGNMSIVGPRPHATETKAVGRLFEEFIDNYASRHRVKPGITGWAQVNGWRGETDTEEKILKRVEYDIWYVENWGLFLDFYIIVKTAFVVLLDTKNTY